MIRVFSTRLRWDLRPNPLSRLLREKRERGASVLDLTESNPTRVGLEYPGEEILAALADASSLSYHPAPLGLETAREAVSRYYAERGAEIPASHIALTASTSEAYSYLFKLLADPGGEVLAPRPSYPLFEHLAALEAVQMREYPLAYDGAWRIDLDTLGRAVTPQTRAVVVVNPNNPTGSFVKADEMAELEQLAASRRFALISDEVFSDYAFAPDPHRAASVSSSKNALTFSLGGLSKAAGLPQMKLAWIAVSGPGSEAAIERLEWIADTYLPVGTPVQGALPRLLACSNQVREQIRSRTRANLDVLRRSIGPQSACRALSVEGGWYAILQVPRTRTEEQWVLALLGERDVLVQPGYYFDFESEAFLVLSLITRPGVFEEAVLRLLAEA